MQKTLLSLLVLHGAIYEGRPIVTLDLKLLRNSFLCPGKLELIVSESDSVLKWQCYVAGCNVGGKSFQEMEKISYSAIMLLFVTFLSTCLFFLLVPLSELYL